MGYDAILCGVLGNFAGTLGEGPRIAAGAAVASLYEIFRESSQDDFVDLASDQMPLDRAALVAELEEYG